LSFFEDAVEDAIVSLVETGAKLPQHLDILYTEAEWVAVERFHRLKVKKDRSLGMVADRYPFVRLQVLGISVFLGPKSEVTVPRVFH